MIFAKKKKTTVTDAARPPRPVADIRPKDRFVFGGIEFEVYSISFMDGGVSMYAFSVEPKRHQVTVTFKDVNLIRALEWK